MSDEKKKIIRTLMLAKSERKFTKPHEQSISSICHTTLNCFEGITEDGQNSAALFASIIAQQLARKLSLKLISVYAR